jgi:hypothetical protein
LTNAETYLKDDETNYLGLVIVSLPLDVQIVNALVLLISSRLIRKRLKQFIFCIAPTNSTFVTAIGEPTRKSKWDGNPTNTHK